MPIYVGSPVVEINGHEIDRDDPLLDRKVSGYGAALELGNPKLEWHQAEFIKLFLERGQQHYLGHYRDEYGRVKCTGGNGSGPCLCHFGGGLWHEPGLGKTFSALWYELLVRKFLKEQNDPRAGNPSLFITTTSAKWQLASTEIPKWRPDLCDVDHVMVIEGDSIVREKQIELMAMMLPQIVVMHHAQLSPQTTGLFELVQDIDWLGLYMDEDQYYKNWSSARTVRKNAIKRGFELSISGTPQSGYPDKLHAILHGMAFGHYQEWTDPPCTPGPSCPLPDYTRRAFAKSCKGCFNYLAEANGCKVGGHLESMGKRLGIKYQYDPGEFGDFGRFKSNFCQLESNRVVGSMHEQELNRRIYGRGWAHRVTTKEVYGERSIPIIKIALKMSEAQNELYQLIANGLRKYFDENLEEAVSRGSSYVLAMLTHVRRVTTLSPAAFMLAYGNHPPGWAALDAYLPQGESSKIEWALGFIDDNVSDTANKIIIGSEWDDCLEDLKGRLIKQGYKQAKIGIVEGAGQLDWSIRMDEGPGEYFATINGAVKDKQRTAIQRAFNTDPRLKVLLMTQAGYEALNLTGGVGKGDRMYVTCLGVPWLPDKLRQLFGRADRLDMEGDIVVYLPACVGTIDEMVHSILYGKSLSSDRIIDGLEGDEVARRLSLRDAQTLKQLLGSTP